MRTAPVPRSEVKDAAAAEGRLLGSETQALIAGKVAGTDVVSPKGCQVQAPGVGRPQQEKDEKVERAADPELEVAAQEPEVRTSFPAAEFRVQRAQQLKGDDELRSKRSPPWSQVQAQGRAKEATERLR